MMKRMRDIPYEERRNKKKDSSLWKGVRLVCEQIKKNIQWRPSGRRSRKVPAFSIQAP